MVLQAIKSLHVRFAFLTASRQFFRLNHTRAISRSTPVPALQLRDYQESCIEACLSALKRGITRIGVSLPTGSGKTAVFVSLLHKLPTSDGRPSAKRSLIIVNSVELAVQAANQVRQMFPDATVEVEQGKNKASGLADITVATYQTLLRGDRLQKFPAGSTRAVIVDEAHHAAAKSYLSILSHFDPSVGGQGAGTTPSRVPIFGFSATFTRHDGLALGSVFQEIVYHRDFLQMIKEQWLCNVRFTTVKTNIDLSSVSISRASGDFVPSSLAHIMNTSALNSLVVRSWIDRAGKRKSTLVFCANLAHVHDLTNEFRARGIDARYIHAGTRAKERQCLLDDFRAGAFPVLVNCAILTEGADIPNIDCVVVARPTRSRNVFAQMIGRGMRLSPETGKQDCHILDFVDSQGRVSGMFSTPSLFGLDPNEIMPGSTLDELMQKKEETKDKLLGSAGPSCHDNIEIKSATYKDYDDPFSWQYHTNKEKHIKQLSAMAWVPVRGGYVLETLGRGTLRIELFESAGGEKSWEVSYVAAWDRGSMIALVGRPVTRAGRTRRIALVGTLEEAIRAAESFAKMKLAPGVLANGLLRTAAWRKGRCSVPQREMIAKSLGISLDKGSDYIAADKAHMREWCRIRTRDDLSRLSKGDAADLITRLRSGAKGAYDRELKKRAREAKLQQKEEERLAREVVRVGPLRG